MSGYLVERNGMFGVHGTGDTSGYGGLVRTFPMPGGAERPYGGWFDEVADVVEQVVDTAPSVTLQHGEITFHVRPGDLPALVKSLRDDERLGFEVCASISGVHYPADKGAELHAVYHFLSMRRNRRIRVEVSVPEENPHIPSIVSTYPTADWHERETWDMFGIVFDGHPALTRILMPDDWPGFPQRKDYPLGGIPVEYHGSVVPPPDERRQYS